MALQRRTLLSVVSVVGVGLAGCAGGEGPEGTETDTPTATAEPYSEPRDVHVVVHNQLSDSVTVSVELSTEGTVLVDDEATMEVRGFARFDTGIDETGRYHLVVATDDREKEITFEMDEYDLEMGSNVIFWIDEHGIRYGTED